MPEMPVSVEPVVKRLSRRLTLGLFLDIWPPWAAGGLLVAGAIALACRLFFPVAAPLLPWLALAPAIASVPPLVMVALRAYREEQVVALADALGGGHGLLLTLLEKYDARWAESPLIERTVNQALPALRPRRRLAPLAPAVAFFVVTLWLPQRTPPPDRTVVADTIAADLAATLARLQEQELITQEEEEKLEEEIERIRRAAEERPDASSWEAADALRDRMAGQLTAKQDAVRWAEEALQRYAAAAAGGGANQGEALQTASAELAEAIGKLASSGLLANASPELRQLLEGGRIPGDAESLGELAGLLSKYLEELEGDLGEAARPGRGFGRFDVSEFGLGESDEPNGFPGRGGLDRGRADAELTWGKETLPHDRFRAEALPPGAPRSPDDWAPIVELPGAPNAGPVRSRQASARQYDPSAGAAAWRRTLKPRHQSAVKKYFADTPRQDRRSGG